MKITAFLLIFFVFEQGVISMFKHIDMSQGISEASDHNLRFSFDSSSKDSSIQKCGVASDCKQCEMNGFYQRCHETLCYCCNDERRCWCQK